MTPEGKVKQKIREVLKIFGCYQHAPVLNGMGKPSLDFIGCHKGRFFAVEAKAPGKNLTIRQEQTKAEIEAAGGTVFKVSNKQEIEVMIGWLENDNPQAK